METLIGRLLGPGLMPHGSCVLWYPELLWLHVGSDGLIALSYLTISLVLVVLVRKRQLPFGWMFQLFSAFIVLCGFTHLAAIWVMWSPDYLAEGGVKLVTALVSAATAVLLIPLLPRVMLLRSPTTLESLNRALADQVAERVAAEQRVERANAELELRVQDRTAELTQMNRALQAEIGERQRATREATRNEARLRTLIETAVDGIAIIDQRGQVQLFNRACERMFGYRAEDVLGRNVSMLMASPDRERHDDYLQHYLQTREARIIGIGRAVVGRRRDGSQFTLDLSVGETRDGDEPIFVGILRDISDRQRAEAELTLRSAELERSNRELESFAYVASHDLKAPLRGIDNLARWIEEDLGEALHGETRDNMALLRGRVARLERLLDDILAYSRVGRQPDAVETFDPSELPETLRALIAPAPAFAVELAGDLAQFFTYRGQLEQVLANLVGNAIKHHDRDHGRVVVSFADAGSRVAVEVADDGPGIEPRFHQRIFEMFQTLRPRDQVEGSGMGLSIVRKLVESHGGMLEVVSQPPVRGCCIRFTWPKAEMRIQETSGA